MRGITLFCAIFSVAVAAPQGYSYGAQSGAQPQRQPHTQYGPLANSNAAAFLKDLQTVMTVQTGQYALSSQPQPLPQLEQHGATEPQPMAIAMPPQDRHLSPIPLTSVNANMLTHIQSYQAHQPQHITAPEPIITKRFFLHAAPEDDEAELKEHHLTVGQPRKNYNVVFIKAPSKSAQKTAIKITPALNEEKTVIYVLDKKHDLADIDAQVQEPVTSTAKPEVYFIKYKTAEEAAHAQQTIQAQYDALGGSTQLIDEGVAPVSSVIGTLGAAKEMASVEIAAEAQEQRAPLIPVVPPAAEDLQSGDAPFESMESASTVSSSGSSNNNNAYLPTARYYR